MSTAHGTEPVRQPGQVELPSLAWVLKRVLIGIAILFVMFGGGAWLLYASIEPEPAQEDTAIARPASAATAPSATRLATP